MLPVRALLLGVFGWGGGKPNIFEYQGESEGQREGGGKRIVGVHEWVNDCDLLVGGGMVKAYYLQIWGEWIGGSDCDILVRGGGEESSKV